MKVWWDRLVLIIIGITSTAYLYSLEYNDPIDTDFYIVMGCLYIFSRIEYFVSK